MSSKNKERTMAFELGGRADKFGNRYERRYFVSLMAKVLQGGLLSVQSEPTGDDESGTDIIIEYQGGRIFTSVRHATAAMSTGRCLR